MIKLVALATLKQVEEMCRRAPAAVSALITKDEWLSQGNGSGDREQTKDAVARGQDQIQRDVATTQWRERTMEENDDSEA